MTAAERAFWLTVQRQVGVLEPDVMQALRRAFEILRDALSLSVVVRLLMTRQWDRVNELLSRDLMDRAFAPYRTRVRGVVEKGFRYATRDLPQGGRINGVIGVSFDVLSEKTVTAIRTLETDAIQSLKDEVRDVVRAHVEDGLREGKGPKEIARGLRSVIGMSPTQSRHAANYRVKLETAGKLSAEQIDKAVATYERRAIALNTETNARTITLQAMKTGRRLAWEDAGARGIVDTGRLMKKWSTVIDGRERPEHHDMNGQVVRYDDAYPNGDSYAGEGDPFNCRCLDLYFQRVE